MEDFCSQTDLRFLPRGYGVAWALRRLSIYGIAVFCACVIFGVFLAAASRLK
jgi:hypothetical protein